ncbi:MAG TPA: hypothetical protein PLT07_09050, partial [Trueperaceae bacterium]|nr:hypothetical protein [Trueperaceae bacterium]
RQTQLRQAETLSLSVVAIGLLEPFRDAVIDPRPVNDRTLFITVVAFVLAVLAVYLVMFFAAATSPRVRNSNDMLTAADEEPIIVLPPESRGPQFAAAVERLAVALQALRRPTGNDDTVPIGLVVAVASPTDPNEKSLMALYLAKAYMRAGLSVLVVDADFKYSVASQALPAPRGGPTLADLLQKGAGAQVASKVPGLATLEYIPAGARNGVGSSVSLARRMPGFINFWRSRYDVIIIDTPPSGDFPDAYSLANTVDAVVLLARAYMTPLDAYRTTVEVLEGSGAGSIFKVLSVGRRRRLPKASAELSSEWSDARGGAAPEAKVRVVSRSRG